MAPFQSLNDGLFLKQGFKQLMVMEEMAEQDPPPQAFLLKYEMRALNSGTYWFVADPVFEPAQQSTQPAQNSTRGDKRARKGHPACAKPVTYTLAGQPACDHLGGQNSSSGATV